MPDYDTVTELLIAQPERKLHKMRTGIVVEIERLGVELRLVDEALSRKRLRGEVQRVTKKVEESTEKLKAAVPSGNGGGRFRGLPRNDLLAYIKEVGHPVKPNEMTAVLVGKGIVRRTEAVRTAMSRLERDGELTRTADGSYAVALSGGVRIETETLPGELGLESSGEALPGV